MDAPDLDEQMMRLAIAEALAAQAAGEVPVGAIVVAPDNTIIGRGQNRVLRDSDPTAHAEVVALRQAGLALNNYRLTNCTLYVTLEPCAMCAGAILHARLTRLIYAADDPKAGACGSVLSVMNHPQLNHKVEVHSGLLAEECGPMLSNFFLERRRERSPSVRILPMEELDGGKPMTTKKKWSAKVDTDSTHPEEGLFNQSASSIAKALASKKVSPKGPGLGYADAELLHQPRRQEPLARSRHAELEKAKSLLSDIIAKQKEKTQTDSNKSHLRKSHGEKKLKKAVKQASKENSVGKSPARSRAQSYSDHTSEGNNVRSPRRQSRHRHRIFLRHRPIHRRPASLPKAQTSSSTIATTPKEQTRRRSRSKPSAAKPITVQADVSKLVDTQNLIDQAYQQLGRCDILVNNAGIEKEADFWDVTEQDYDAVLNVNLKGAFFLTQAFVRRLRDARQPGRIINISSVHEDMVFPHFSTYCASKGAMRMLMRNLAVELGPLGITVNNIAPGAIITPINTVSPGRQATAQCPA